MNFFCPVPDQFQKAITQKFGENPADYARFHLKGHNGVDFGVPLNTPIYSACNGVVLTVSDDVQGYGQYIKVSTGAYDVIYAHLSCILVKVGEKLATGQVIARSGSTGNSTGPHLHFEIRQLGLEGNGYFGAVDPLPLLSQDLAQPQTPPLSYPPGKYKVLVTALNVRLAPGGEDRGDVLEQDTVEVTGPPVLKNGMQWVPIQLWVAPQFNNDPYLEAFYP
jgi:hypothetical protein